MEQYYWENTIINLIGRNLMYSLHYTTNKVWINVLIVWIIYGG